MSPYFVPTNFLPISESLSILKLSNRFRLFRNIPYVYYRFAAIVYAVNSVWSLVLFALAAFLSLSFETSDLAVSSTPGSAG